MFRPRATRTLASFVFGWFVLFVALGSVAPMVHPPVPELVCSVAGAAPGQPGNGDAVPVAAHGIECPLCLLLHAPPALAAFAAAAPVAAAAPRLPAAAQARGHAAVPPPARGPPLFA